MYKIILQRKGKSEIVIDDASVLMQDDDELLTAFHQAVRLVLILNNTIKENN